jgi:hypothetical protein
MYNNMRENSLGYFKQQHQEKPIYYNELFQLVMNYVK